jgi:hypothetical protein
MVFALPVFDFALFRIGLSVYQSEKRRCTLLGFFDNLSGPGHGGSGGIYISVYAAVLVRGTRSTELFVLIRFCFRYCKDGGSLLLRTLIFQLGPSCRDLTWRAKVPCL